MTCSLGDCLKPRYCRDLCKKHYVRWKRHGDPRLTKIIAEESTPEERLRFYGWQSTENGCWKWCGPARPDGYGRVGASGTRVLAHRLAYETWVGPIPEGHVVRHKCDSPPCINPDHLETGTQQDNVQDMHRRRRRQETKIYADRYEELHELYEVQRLRQVDIARLWGVEQSTISRHIIKMRGLGTNA